MSNINKRQELQKLYSSVGPNLITLYKTYLVYYGNWCKDNQLISKFSEQFQSLNNENTSDDDDDDDEAIIYKHLPISSQLIHRFLIETLIKKQVELNNNDIIESLSQWIMGLIFIGKLCHVYGNPMVRKNPIEENYLYGVIDLHKYGKNSSVQVPVYQISINAWNSNTKNLNPIHFKTANEKLRFLVDFHFTTYLRLTFEERSNLKLCSLITKPHKNINISVPGSSIKLDVINYDPHMNEPPAENYKPMALAPHQSPFLCPYTSLASYLFIRFYGIQYFSKGEGFPDLLDNEFMKNMPLITNKFNNEYPKETAISICYSAMFKYCNLPYKKRAYFERLSPVSPTWKSISSYFEFARVFHNDTVPWDYLNILNGNDPYVDKIDFEVGINSNVPSQDVITLFFPEIEKYKAQLDRLSNNSQNFIKLLETIRIKFVLDLPVIYKVFPEHDIFINPIFKDPRVQYYLNGIQLQDNETLPFQAKLPINTKGEDETTLFNLYKELTDQPSFLSEIEETISTNLASGKILFNGSSIPLDISKGIDFRKNIKTTVTITKPEELLEELRSENFKFIQYQTLHNFESFITLISKIFSRLSLKESSKLEIEKTMEHYKKLLMKKIQESTPNDIKQHLIANLVTITKSEKEVKDRESDSGSDSDSDTKIKGTKTKKGTPPFKIFSVGGQSSDEEESENEKVKSNGKRQVSDEENDDEEETSEEEDNEDQEEQLKDMIDELVTTKVETLLKRQMDMLESKVERLVDEMIESKLESKFDFFIENRMKRTVENYMRDNEFDSVKRFKKQESNFAQRVLNRTAALSDAKEGRIRQSSESEFLHTSPNHIQDETSTNVINDTTPNENPFSDSPDRSNGFSFHMDPSLKNIEDIVLEWFSPNPTMDNECVHSMNKKYGKTWRLKNDSIYKIRKSIVDFYVYLTNVESVDKLQAIAYCKNLQGERSMDEFSKFLRTYKKSNNNSFKGLYLA
ncbi:centromere DNA-binding protein complex CBF3 subunit A [Monosporozyma unispora]|nr:hypothetical protein C6P44_004248 [Kazachstania unispora]